MDCCICSAMPVLLRPPRNTICGTCYEAARSIIAFTTKLECDSNEGDDESNSSMVPLHSPSKGIGSAFKWLESSEKERSELAEKILFLGGFAKAFTDQCHTDIQIIPGNGGPPTPAHRALLASRSEIFKTMLEGDGFKTPPKESITLSELNHEQLQALLEFLYSGTLPQNQAQKHVYTLSLAADKYEIPYLQRFCEHKMLASLNVLNALDTLEISDTCSNQTVVDVTLNYIVKHMEDIIFSTRYDGFALRNPHLGVKITRAIILDHINKT